MESLSSWLLAGAVPSVSGRPCLVALSKDGEFVENWGGVHEIKSPGEVTMEVEQYKFKIRLDANCYPTVVNHIPHRHAVMIFGEATDGAPSVNYQIDKGNEVTVLGDFYAIGGAATAHRFVTTNPDVKEKKVVRPYNYFN